MNNNYLCRVGRKIRSRQNFCASHYLISKSRHHANQTLFALLKFLFHLLFKPVLVNVEKQYVWKQLQMLCASEMEAITVIKNKQYNTGSYWPQTVHTEAATVGWEPGINRNWGPYEWRAIEYEIGKKQETSSSLGIYQLYQIMVKRINNWVKLPVLDLIPYRYN